MEVRAKGGNTIPMVFVTTANGNKGIDAIPYASLKNDMRKSVRELRKTLEEVDVLDSGAKDDEGADALRTAEQVEEQIQPRDFMKFQI